MEQVLCNPQIHNEKDFLPELTDEFDWLHPKDTADETIRHWLVWAYLCWGSLMAKGCEVATLLANQTDEIQRSAHCFGQHLAIARQVSCQTTQCSVKLFIFLCDSCVCRIGC